MTQQFLRALVWLLLFVHQGLCVHRTNCQWGPFGDWSECDGCTKLQTRSRAMVVYAQFGGSPCDGARTETRSCETTRGCPLEDGCGDRFRCVSGKCISKSLLCNGDQDCEEDGLDERACESRKYITCVGKVLPPNVELLGQGVDAVSGKRKGIVINTKSFGSQCRHIYPDYRLPDSIIKYQMMVKVQNDFSDEMFSSKWHYAKDIVTRETVKGTTKGHRNYDFHETVDTTQSYKLVVLRNDIEVVQFQSNSPRYMQIAEEFWKALGKLPSVYDYAAYRKVLERFGTHYVSEGSLGGSFNVVININAQTEKRIVTETEDYHECEKKKRWILIFPITVVKCKSGQSQHHESTGSSSSSSINEVDVEGGGVEHIAALKLIQLGDPARNWEIYSNWADSITSFPKIVKQKLRPLSELVKEVQCAGVKRHYLRRAIDQYLSESDACHCGPCSNNGLAVMDGDTCRCICKPGTSGLACEHGTEVEGQPGVIHGSWSCWSTWSSCSGSRRSRSRSCSNPSPQNGGLSCIGEPTDTSTCDDEELKYLRTMEPECFDMSLPVTQRCEAPPVLINGYILDPKDIYLVGSRVEYTCSPPYYLLGSPIECTAALSWSHEPGLCTVSKCKIPFLVNDVIVSPMKATYDVGENLTLTCPEGKELQGEREITCETGLFPRFSRDPQTFQCVPVRPTPSTTPSVQCKPWEKYSHKMCVCKMPFECGSSLELCATIQGGSARSLLLNVCKMQALQCVGKDVAVADDSGCTWPPRNTAGCVSCHMWEACDDQTNQCKCKATADCSTPEVNVCVRVGEDATAAAQTMSECEAGLRRCKGEKVSVVSIQPCAS